MRAICPQCAGRGAVKVNYRSGHPFDIGLCDCSAGAILRPEIESAPERLERRFGVALDRIWPIEELLDSRPGPGAGRAADESLLVNAGKVNRAGLGGKKPV